MQKSRMLHQVQSLEKKISLAANSSKLRGEIRNYLRSYAARTLAVEEAKRKKRVKLSKTEVQSIAQELNVWDPCVEEVILHPKLKEGSQGDFRWLLSYGIENASRQILVRNALAAVGGLAPEQTIYQGGRDEAIKRVIQNYEAGYDHVFELDVYKCFKSFDRTKIGNYLGLPERVVTNVLSGVNLKISLSTQYGDNALAYEPSDASTSLDLITIMDSDWGPAQQGLSEGSIVSPLAAEMLLAWIVKNVTDGAWRIVVYADNFLCQCQDEKAAHALNIGLRELLHKHPAGPLKANSGLSLISPENTFHFLGYAFDSSDGTAKPCLGEGGNLKLRRLRKNAYKMLNAPNVPIAKKTSVYKHTLKKQREIVGGYKEWSDAKDYLKIKEAKLRMHAELAGVSVQKKEKKGLIINLPKHS